MKDVRTGTPVQPWGVPDLSRRDADPFHVRSGEMPVTRMKLPRSTTHAYSTAKSDHPSPSGLSSVPRASLADDDLATSASRAFADRDTDDMHSVMVLRTAIPGSAPVPHVADLVSPLPSALPPPTEDERVTAPLSTPPSTVPGAPSLALVVLAVSTMALALLAAGMLGWYLRGRVDASLVLPRAAVVTTPSLEGSPPVVRVERLPPPLPPPEVAAEHAAEVPSVVAEPAAPSVAIDAERPRRRSRTRRDHSE